MWYSVDLTYDVKQQRVRHIVASRAAPLEIIFLPCSMKHVYPNTGP